MGSGYFVKDKPRFFINRRENCDNPCHGCCDRHIACHSTCKRYLDFKQKSLEDRQKFLSSLDDGGASDFLIRSTEKRRKQYKTKR